MEQLAYTHRPMAKKKQRKKQPQTRTRAATEPKFPYTVTPGALRTFLKQVPEKPRPTRINRQLLKSWGHGDTNAGSIIRVLKRLGLVASGNEPTPDYDAFMHAQTGPAVLGNKIKEVYAPLFNASKAPYKEPEPALRNLFNIHSGGSASTISYQIQTFKALCDHATFDAGGAPTTLLAVSPAGAPGQSATGGSRSNGGGSPTIHIDLHIHLPPDKSSREYQAMFEDIGRYLLGKGSGDESS